MIGGGGLPARWRLVALDLVGVSLAASTFLGRGEPDLLFHGVWVVLVIEAFWFGLRVSIPRIVLAAALVVSYSLIDEVTRMRPLEVYDLIFTEWPLMLVIILIVAVMADRVTTANRDIADLERRTHEQLMTARDDERQRLSADLHDGVGQTLTALVFTLDAAETALATGDEAIPPGSRETLHRAQEIAGLALEETRDVARRFRPARMSEIGLANAIRELAAHAGRPIEVAFDPKLAAPSLLPVQDELQAYRIVQEAVANAVRHASARTIVIGLRAVRGSRLQIEVVDDGTGFDPEETDGDGLGLQGMRERAAAIGGTLSLDSQPGLGTRIRLLLPMAPQQRGADA